MSSDVLGTLWRKYVEVQHRLIAKHLTPVHRVWRHHQQTARRQQRLFLTDVKTYLPREDIHDLLMRMLVRKRRMPGHQAVQGQSGTPSRTGCHSMAFQSI